MSIPNSAPPRAGGSLCEYPYAQAHKPRHPAFAESQRYKPETGDSMKIQKFDGYGIRGQRQYHFYERDLSNNVPRYTTLQELHHEKNQTVTLSGTTRGSFGRKDYICPIHMERMLSRKSFIKPGIYKKEELRHDAVIGSLNHFNNNGEPILF
ncbi:MAG: hypothetical protein R3E13_06795 [Alphaproteobacteria bacterium]